MRPIGTARPFALFPTLLLLSACGPAREAAPVHTSHTYYVAAEEVAWDYAPSGADGVTGKPFAGNAVLVATSGHHRIGRVYKKAIYREYTDSTFTTLKPRPPAWEHLGMLGPLLRGGDCEGAEASFRAAREADPAFVLSRSEAGHPAWGPVYRRMTN